jgi:hypothetical protein
VGTTLPHKSMNLLKSSVLNNNNNKQKWLNVEWRRLLNEELHSLYRSPNIVKVIKSRRLRWAGHIARMEESGSGFKIITGKPTGKRTLGRPRCRWEDNIRMDLEDIGINAGIGLIRLRIGIIGEPLWMRLWTPGSTSHGVS